VAWTTKEVLYSSEIFYPAHDLCQLDSSLLPPLFSHQICFFLLVFVFFSVPPFWRWAFFYETRKALFLSCSGFSVSPFNLRELSERRIEGRLSCFFVGFSWFSFVRSRRKYPVPLPITLPPGTPFFYFLL